MVLQIQRVPRAAVEGVLPLAEGPLEPPEAEGALQKVRHEAVGLHVLEVEHQVELAALQILERLLRLQPRTLAEQHAVVLVRHGAVFGQVFVHVRAVVIELHARGGGQLHLRAGQAGRFGDIGYHVLAEAVHAHVQPEAHDVLDLLPHGGLAVVEVGLLFGEGVQVVLPALRVVLPGPALEEAVPVVGRQHGAGAGLFPRPPEVIFAVGAVRVPAGLKPGVLVAGVVHDKVHEHAHTALVRPVEHLFEYVEVPVFGVYAPVVRHVVAEVGVGRGVERREPDGVHPQALYVVELGEHAVEVADAVTVAVAEAARPYLIDDHRLVPVAASH